MNLVTGATGFIGSHIAEKLVKSGNSVVALVRRTSNLTFLKQLGVEVRYGDVTDAESVKQAMQGVATVYHSAALADEWISYNNARKINVLGTKNILDAASEVGVNRFIYVSSLAVLGMRDHYSTPVDAAYKKSGDPYIDTKIEAEQMVLDYYCQKKLPVSVVRPGFVFGPRDTKVIPRIISKLQEGKFIFVGKGDNILNIVYIENLIDVIMRVSQAQHSVGKVYNVTNDSKMQLKDFIYKIASLWGIEKPIKSIPKALAYLLCELFERSARLIGSKTPPLITKARIKFLTLNLDFDISHTRKDLGYEPLISVEEGLERTKQWLETDGLQKSCN